MRYILIYLLISISYFPIKLHGQDDYIVNQAKFLQKTNASFYGMNQLNRVGVLYNSIKVNEKLAMDNKYVFGSIAFQDKNFSLGFDVNSFKLNDLGMTTSLAYLTYVYKIQISNYTFFLPGISVGMISSRINTDNLIFGDQLSMATGFIAAETQDRLAPMISNASDFDLGASFIIHNEFYMAGLSLRHLRKPNISYNKEAPVFKPIRISVQGGYEFNINPFD